MTQKLILIAVLSGLILGGCEAASELPSKLRGSKQTQTTPDATPVSAEASPPAVQAEVIKPLGYLLDVNEATPEQLLRVPGLDENIKKMIHSTRPFLDMVEFDDELTLMNVSEKDRTTLYGYLFMVVDINNSPIEDIFLVPGLSKGLAYKIQSGRPYNSRAELKDLIENSRKGEDVEQIMAYFKVKTSKN